jgi:hypothetical protein
MKPKDPLKEIKRVIFIILLSGLLSLILSIITILLFKLSKSEIIIFNVINFWGMVNWLK